MYLKNKKQRIFAGIILVLIIFILLIYLIPLPRALNKPLSKVIRYSSGKVMRVYLSSDEKWRIYLPIDNTDELFKKSTIMYEDKYFWLHPGINIIALLRAFYLNIKAGEIISGGSTISMQLARLVEPKPRTVRSKLIEMFRAIQFELRLGKKRILETYINIAPYGGNVEGVGAACLAYFGCLPENLLPEEVAFLVSIPQSPVIRKPGNIEESIKARDNVLKIMFKNGLISQHDYKRAGNAPVPMGFMPFPMESQHAADFAMLKYPYENDIIISIDEDMQKKAENIVKSYQKRIEYLGASNISVVVIENKTGKVRSLIGSIDYYNNDNDGQVRGFYAYRSPGSALKPFLYALALEKGIISTEMLIEDAPHSFGSFAPINFSEKWDGLITAENALSKSLNMPFVIMLQRTGYKDFMEKLYAGNLKGQRFFDDYGLTVITGGMEVKLLNLVNLYSCLSNGGKYKAWSVLQGESIFPDTLLFRSGAVFLTLKALAKKGRPDAPKIENYNFPKTHVYWKTGTSWERRDAWSIGFQKTYTVGVWVGNFSGEGAEGIVGGIAASPIMFDIIRAIETEMDKEEFDWKYDALDDIELTELCSYSGYKAGMNCIDREYIYVLKNANPFEKCPFHKKFMIEKETGYRASPWEDYKEGEIVERIFTIYPSAVQKIMGNRGKIPSFSPKCAISLEMKSLQVISPIHNSVIMIPRGIKNASYVMLQAYTSSKQSEIYWFLNGKYIGPTLSGEIKKVIAQPGEMQFVVQDKTGETKKIDITVFEN